MAFSDHFLQIQSAYKGFKARKEINEKTKLSQSVKPPQKPAPKKVEETKETPKETSYSFFGRFMSSGTKEQEQAKVVVDTLKKTEPTEKKSLFGFFGRSSSKKEIIVESKPQTIKPIVEQRSTPKGKTTITGATNKTRTATLKEKGGMKDPKFDLPDAKSSRVKETAPRKRRTADVVNAAITIQTAFKKYKKRKALQLEREDLPDLKDKKIQDATLKIQTAYRGFRTRKELEDSGITLPKTKYDNVAKATLRIQAYYRGFKVRKAMRDQEKKQNQVSADLEQVAMRMRLPQTEKRKNTMRNLPATPRQSVDLPTPPKPPRPNVPPKVVRGKSSAKSVPHLVDERDLRKKPPRPLGPAPSSVIEERSKEYEHHPADVVAAAMTIKRFFKRIKAKKEASKQTLRSYSTATETTESATEDSSTTEQSDSSESEYHKGDIAGESKESTTESDSDEESTVKFGSIKRRPPVKSAQKQMKPESQDRDLKKSVAKTAVSDSDSDSEEKVTARGNSSQRRKVPSKRKSSPEIENTESMRKNEESQPASRFSGFFSSKKVDNQKEEKRSMFGFFSKSEPQKDMKEPLQSKKVEEQNKARKSGPGTGSKSSEIENMSVIKTFRGEEPKARKLSSESELDLPDLKAEDVVAASIKIQAAYRGFQTRKAAKKKRSMAETIHAALVIQSAFKKYKERKIKKQIEADLPDIGSKDVQEATLKIQSCYRGFKTRKQVESKKQKASDVLYAAMKIQKAFRRYKARKTQKEIEAGLPDIGSKDVQEATLKIQSCYRGFKTRKQVENKKQRASDVLFAAMIIQRSFRRYKARKTQGTSKNTKIRKQTLKKKKYTRSSPESSDSDRIVSSDSSDPEYEEVKKSSRSKTSEKKARKKVSRTPDSSETESDAMESMDDTDVETDLNKRRLVPDSSATESEVGESMPDLDDSDVEDAALKIQSVFRGFQARKNVEKVKKFGRKKPRVDDILLSTIIIQRSYRRYKIRKDERKRVARAQQQQKLSKELQRRTSKVGFYLFFSVCGTFQNFDKAWY